MLLPRCLSKLTGFCKKHNLLAEKESEHRNDVHTLFLNRTNYTFAGVARKKICRTSGLEYSRLFLFIQIQIYQKRKVI